jgi:hypothetical protein
MPSFADALRAHGCANFEIEVIENSDITSRMSSPMLWLSSSNGMPRNNDDYRVLCRGTRRTYVESQGGREALSDQRCSTTMDMELDINSASQNLYHKDSRREPVETEDGITE